MIQVKVDQQQLRSLAGELRAIPKGLATVAARGINKTLTSLKAEGVRIVAGGYAIKAGEVRPLLQLKLAHRDHLDGRMKGEGSPGIPLARFARIKRVPSTQRTRSGGYTPKIGIPVLVRKTSGKLIAAGVFLARLRSGHVGAFYRADPSQSGRRLRGSKIRVGQSKLGKRYIKEAYGPSPIKVLGSRENRARLERFAQDVLNKNLKREAEFYLGKAGR